MEHVGRTKFQTLLLMFDPVEVEFKTDKKTQKDDLRKCCFYSTNFTVQEILILLWKQLLFRFPFSHAFLFFFNFIFISVCIFMSSSCIRSFPYSREQSLDFFLLRLLGPKSISRPFRCRRKVQGFKLGILHGFTRWWFQTFFIFTSILGEQKTINYDLPNISFIGTIWG